METSAQQQSTGSEADKTIARTPGKVLFWLLPILFLIIGLVVGVLAGKSFLASGAVKPDVKLPSNQITESELPVALSLLKNPIIKQWRGGVEGTVTAKDADSFVVSDGSGNTVTIPIRVLPGDSPMAHIYDIREEDKSQKEITIEELPIGAYVRTDFFVVPGSPSKIVGGRVDITKKP